MDVTFPLAWHILRVLSYKVLETELKVNYDGVNYDVCDDMHWYKLEKKITYTRLKIAIFCKLVYYTIQNKKIIEKDIRKE